MPKEIKPNQVYTTEETRDFLRISESTMKRFLKGGVIKAHKVGGRYRIWGSEILQLLSPGLELGASKIYRRIKNKTKEIIKKW